MSLNPPRANCLKRRRCCGRLRPAKYAQPAGARSMRSGSSPGQPSPAEGTRMANEYAGLLMIGDPHLEGRQPGFRRDDYPTVILDKLAWALDYAAHHRLLPAILGDLFDKPRDNPNWMLVRLLDLLQGEVIGLFGNHDCADPELRDHDSLSVLVKSGRLRLVNAECPWEGVISGRRVIVGGSSYRQPIPRRFDWPASV